MARKSWVQCPVTNKLIPKEEYVRPVTGRSAAVHAGFEAFKSPVDGSIINGPKGLREHNKKHGVTNIQDYGDSYFERKHKERSADILGQTKQAKKERVETIRKAIHRHTH